MSEGNRSERMEKLRKQMGDETFKLVTEGCVFSPHGMTCICCKLPVGLQYNHEPLTEEQIFTKGFVMPGTVWGKDVSVICMKCSYGLCTDPECSCAKQRRRKSA